MIILMQCTLQAIFVGALFAPKTVTSVRSEMTSESKEFTDSRQLNERKSGACIPRACMNR